MVYKLEEKLTEWRRDLHRHPEQGFLEMRTASKVAAEVTRLGFTVRLAEEVMALHEMMGTPPLKTIVDHYKWAVNNGADPEFIEHFASGCTGVVADWDTGRPGPTTVFRVDMDALPIFESMDEEHIPGQLGFRSINEGSMHACGHDAHTAIGIGLATMVAEDPEAFNGIIRIVFQPAEEGTRGAKSMTEAGIVDDADFFIASHIGTGVPHGEFVAAANGFMATTKMDVTFRGRASHAGAQPEEGKNALLAAANATLNLHAISRHSGGASRVNVGELQGGGGRNVIADTAFMKIETRGETSEVNDFVRNQAKNILQGAALMYDAECDIHIVGEAISCKCSEGLAAMVGAVAKETMGITKVHKADNVSAGSEDATYFMERVKAKGGQATYCIFGTELAAGHHNEKFDIKEETLPVAVDVLYRTVLALNGRE
ncbi:amidohydrolase [Sporosarcina aquimarina]|uniref:Amidohydrolase n=1 Tax=Sporosarcina aquimarina TaxID=114975 RepID=A0ABU4FXF5_9BACL|nr:amidohydrolase [Sporosarcina aquimarina]MDW0108805.1 amidohydrolase [Sporosarcina aquimarina]